MGRPALRQYIKNERGNALVSAFLIIIVLFIFGMGILALTAQNARQAVVTDTFERAYYVAGGGAKTGVEIVRFAVMEQYNSIAEAVKASGNKDIGANQPASFFAGVEGIIHAYLANPQNLQQPDTSAGGPASFTLGIVNNGASPKRTYTIRSTAAGGNATRVIVSTIDITFKQVELSAAAFTPLGSETVLCGGMFDAANAYVSITGTAKFGELKYKKWNFNYNGNSNPSQELLDSLEDTSVAGRLNWNMKYPGFTREAITTAAPTLPALPNGASVTNASFKDPPFNWHVPSPIYLEGQPGASFTVESSLGNYVGGQIVCTGNLTVRTAVDGTAGNYVKMYSSGTFTQSSGQLNYVKIFSDGNVNIGNGPAVKNAYIYSKGSVTLTGREMSNLVIVCDGNLTISGGSSTNVTIYCKGSISDGSNTRVNMKVYCDSYTMSGGNIQGSSILYAERFIHLESTVRGLFYTNGNITCGNGAGVTGQLVAKGNITTPGYSFNQDAALIAQLNVDPFVTSSPADSAVTVTQPIDGEIFTNNPKYREATD